MRFYKKNIGLDRWVFLSHQSVITDKSWATANKSRLDLATPHSPNSTEFKSYSRRYTQRVRNQRDPSYPNPNPNPAKSD